MPRDSFDRRTFLKGAGVAAGTALAPGTAAAINDNLDLEGGTQEIIAVFDDEADMTVLDQFDLVDGYHAFDVLPFAYTRASGPQIRRIADLEGVNYVEKNRELELHNDDARKLTGAEVVQNDLGFTGEGVHAVVIDTGFTLHPDLISNIEHNYHFVDPLTTDDEQMWQDVNTADIDDVGHGSHVGGSIAGDGTASQGQYRGMAPDASITGYKTNIGGALYVIYLLAAIEDVLQKQQAGEIDVQIVNNSFGSSNDGDFNPTESIHVAYWEAFKEGIVPVFSAGNSGPDHGTLNYLGKQPFSLCVGATYDGDNGAAKLPTDFSSRGRPAVEDKGEEYASDYDFSKYEQNEGPFYDRQAALNDIQAFYESGQADAPEVEADYTDQFSVTVATTVTDPTAWTASLGVNGTLVGGDSVYVEWESPPGAGYLDAAIGVGEINRESVYVNLYRGDKETVSDGGGVLVAEDGNVIRDGQLEFGVPIDAETTYTFEFYGFNNVDTQVTANLTARQLVERPEGPFGTHRVDVSAPGNWIMSTAKETEILGGLYTALRQETEPLYTEVSGTSMSCPVTAGIVALVFEAYESEAGFRPKPIDVINIMEATAEGGTEAELAPHTEANMGAGFVDAEAAVKRAKELGAAVASQDGPSSDDPTEAEHPELWDEIELCRVGRGKSLR